MSQPTDSSILENVEAASVVYVSLLDAFPQRTQTPAFLDIVRHSAIGRPIPHIAGLPHLRSWALDLVATLWSCLISDCRTGIAIEDNAGGRVVRLLGFLHYRLSPDRAWVRAMREFQHIERAELVGVGSPLPTWRWVATALRRHRSLLEPLRASLRAAQSNELSEATADATGDESAEAIWRWAVACIEKHARQQLDYRALRRVLRGALDLDPELLNQARRAQPNHECDVSSDWYSACGRFRHHLARVADKAPALLRALGWLIRSHQLQPEDAPLAALKQTLTAAGASREDWRRLLRDPAQPVWRLYAQNRVTYGVDPPELLANWARLHRGLDAAERLPAAMWETILRTCANRLSERIGKLRDWHMRPVLLRAGLKRARAMATIGQFEDFLHHEWAPVVAWVADYRAEGVRSRHRSWTRALRAATDAERCVRAWAQNSDAYPWDSLVTEFEYAGLRARALTCASALVDESIAMRHCADAFILRCASGEVRLFRVEDAASGKHVATIAISCPLKLSRQIPWILDEAKGFANRSASSAVVEMGEALAREYQRRTLQQ